MPRSGRVPAPGRCCHAEAARPAPAAGTLCSHGERDTLLRFRFMRPGAAPSRRRPGPGAGPRPAPSRRRIRPRGAGRRARSRGPGLAPARSGARPRRCRPPIPGEVLTISPRGHLDHLGRAVDRGDRSRRQLLADQRDRDAVAAADLEQAIGRTDVQSVDRPDKPLRCLARHAPAIASRAREADADLPVHGRTTRPDGNPLWLLHGRRLALIGRCDPLTPIPASHGTAGPSEPT